MSECGFLYHGRYEMYVDERIEEDKARYTEVGDIFEDAGDEKIKVFHGEVAGTLKELIKKVIAYNNHHDAAGPYFVCGTVTDTTTERTWNVDRWCHKIKEQDNGQSRAPEGGET